MLVTSPALAGSRRVLESLASLEKALTYCSATEREAAALPCWGESDKAQQRIGYLQELSMPPPSATPAGHSLQGSTALHQPMKLPGSARGKASASPPPVPALKWWLPQGAASHLLCQSSCQELNGLRLGPGPDQHGIGFSCNKERPSEQKHHKELTWSTPSQFQGVNQDNSTCTKTPLPQQQHGYTPATHLLLPQAARQQHKLQLSPSAPAGWEDQGG